MSDDIADSGDPSTLKTLLGDEITCDRQLRQQDRERLSSAYSIVEFSYADLVEFIDGPVPEDPYVIFDSADEEVIREDTFNLYKLLHHYLAALYSFNEAVRSTVTTYLPRDRELTKEHFNPGEGERVEYTRRLAYLRGLRIACQHGAFNDCFSVVQWDDSSDRYRLKFDRRAFSSHERLHNPGEFLRHSNINWQREPLRYIGSFHTTVFHPFYQDCFAWFKTA